MRRTNHFINTASTQYRSLQKPRSSSQSISRRLPGPAPSTTTSGTCDFLAFMHRWLQRWPWSSMWAM